jgi:hypothetical protein
MNTIRLSSHRIQIARFFFLLSINLKVSSDYYPDIGSKFWNWFLNIALKGHNKIENVPTMHPHTVNRDYELRAHFLSYFSSLTLMSEGVNGDRASVSG